MDVELADVRAVRDGGFELQIPSLQLRSGRTTAILGPNGSGKTTLLRLIAGLERPSSGRIQANGADIDPGRHVAYVFQEQVFLRQSVRVNLELGLRLRGVASEQRERRIEEAVHLLGIAHLLDRRADRLSGGEGRRVSLARALCLRAPLMLLDEPLAGLDERTYSWLLDELPPLLARFSATTLIVTHNRHEALRLAQDLVVVAAGRVHVAGEKGDIVTNPRVREVAEVLGHAVLMAHGRCVAVPPGALRPGPGRQEFVMDVDSVVDLVDHREVIGRIGAARVNVALPATAALPTLHRQMLVHAERVCELP